MFCEEIFFILYFLWFGLWGYSFLLQFLGYGYHGKFGVGDKMEKLFDGNEI